MRLTPKFAMILGTAVFVVSLWLDLALVESIVRSPAESRAKLCNALPIDLVKKYCLRRVIAKELDFLKGANFRKLSRNDSLSQGVLSSIRLSSGTAVVLLLDPAERTYRLVATHPLSTIQSYCHVRDTIQFVGFGFPNEHGSGISYVYDSKFSFLRSHTFTDTLTVRDCVASGGNSVWSTYSVGGLVIDADWRVLARTNFGRERSEITSLHENVNMDLDADGKNETYLTPSISNFTILKKQQEGDIAYLVWAVGGTIERMDEGGPGNSVTTLATFTWGYVKEIASVEHSGKSVLFALKSDVLDQDSEILEYSYENGVPHERSYGKILKRECRSLITWNFGFSGINVAIGCERGLYVYSLENGIMSLRKAYDFSSIWETVSDPNYKQVHSLGKFDVNGDWVDEIVAGIDMDGIFVYDLKNETVDEIVDLSQNEYVWFTDEYPRRNPK